MNTDTYRWAWSLLMPATLAVVLVVLFFPLDGVMSSSLQDLKLGPDLRLERQTVQQYGQLSAMLMGLAIIWLIEPQRRRRLLDWLVAVGVATLSCFLLKICFGRPRPKFADPTTFGGIFEAYPFSIETGEIAHRYSWALTNRPPWNLWSMPSSYAALAAVMSVFLVYQYPHLRPSAVARVVLVCCCRAVCRDHDLTDVAVGAVVGYVIAHYAVTFHGGQQAVDWLRWRSERGKASEVSVPIAD